MMNKSKTRKVWGWKVATFLPLLAFFLMAFGRNGENVVEKRNLHEKGSKSVSIVQKQHEQFSRKIEIKKDGNYIDNKLCSLDEIAKKGQEWYKASNDWILLLVDESIPLNRIDEVRGTLKTYFVVQQTVNSDDLVYFAGDVSDLARFTQGKWEDWINGELIKHCPDIKTKSREYEIAYSFIIDKTGKVKDGHIIKKCAYPEINAAFEKILTQIPDWEPAKRDGAKVSTYNNMIMKAFISKKIVN